MATLRLTEKAQRSIALAQDLAAELGHDYIGTEHILYGLSEEGTGIASKALEEQGITSTKIKQEIIELVGTGEPIDNPDLIGFTPRSKAVLEDALIESKRYGRGPIGTNHLLVGVMREADSLAGRILYDLNADVQKLYENVTKKIDEDAVDKVDAGEGRGKGSYNSTPTLNQYGTDLTKRAEEGKLDPVIGRKSEIQRVIEILSRRTKNNPCLIGEPGVGKTAVVEGLAELMVAGDVPETLKDKRLVSLDMAGMVAGAKYRGEFEERIKKVLKEVQKATDVVLFIDEVHTIVATGNAEGAMDAANILKPLLSRGEIQLIGATTLKEYRESIEKDAALERRFSPVMVVEPSEEDTLKIMEGIRDKYEAHHKVKISDAALKACVDLSSRYITDRFLPDKAIDLMDEAASRVRMKSYTEPDSFREAQEEIDRLRTEKEEAVRAQDFEKAAKIRDEEKTKKEELKKLRDEWKTNNSKSILDLTENDIAEVVGSWTGIPVSKVSETENEKLKNLEANLHKRVIGQDEAVSAISKAIKRSRMGLSDPNRPIGSFLFLGPTGVGKTELSKALAENLFGSEDAMIRLDMSEYMESYSTSKLIGSAPGYVGYDDAGQLTEKVRRRPYSVILFDEIEKAHPDVMNILLQILDDGRLTDSQGRTANFKNTVIIMTSNTGANQITEKKTLGFTSVSDDLAQENKEIKHNVMGELKKTFKPEFLNRIDEIIVFKKLNEEEDKKIIDILIKKVVDRLAKDGISLEVDSKARELVAKKGIDNNYGARPLKRAIQTMIEDKVAEAMIDGKVDKKVKVSAKDDEIVVSK